MGVFWVNVPMEFAFWLVKVLFFFKIFFMGFVHSADDIKLCMGVILFLFSFFNVKLIILLIVYSLESCAGFDGMRCVMFETM